MGRTLVLVWLGTASAYADKQQDIGSWAEARHFVPVGPSAPRATAPTEPYDAELAERVEGLLLEARIALDTSDDLGAQAKLGQSRHALQARSIPQAAWLMAEIDRLEAELLRVSDPARAANLERDAEALAGSRAVTYRGPVADLTTSAPPSPAPAVVIEGVRPGDVLYVDGLRRADTRVAAGRHHVVVLHARATVFSGWLEVGGDEGPVSLPAAAPCSGRDLQGVEIAGSRVRVRGPVGCPSWAVARPTPDGIDVALCARARCGSLLPWRRNDGEAFTGEAQPARAKSGFPGWLGWTLAGVAAASATGLVLWQTGAFDAPEPGTTRFMFTAPERPTR